MPATDQTPKLIKPYKFHGVELGEAGGDQVRGNCPFCKRENKFSVETKTGLWRCLVCGTGTEKGGGNVHTFLRSLWAQSKENTPKESYASLAQDRKLLDTSTLEAWGVCKSLITEEWLVPAYTPDNKLSQLYRYVFDRASQKHKLLATSEVQHQIFGVPLFSPKKSTVYICEGPWDAMALWETLRKLKRVSKSTLALTSAETASLLSDANVVAIPGCGSFPDRWSPLFAGKKVYLLFDSDHPKMLGKKTLTAGYDGMKRVSQTLARVEQSPKEIYYLNWGEEGYDPEKTSGYDVRDLLAQGTSIQARAPLVLELEAKLSPIPQDWIEGRAKTASKGGVEIELKPCTSWAVLYNAFGRALKLTEGLDRAFSAMLCCPVSTMAVGDQLWLKIMGPASCGKSTLCEALSTNKKYVLAKSTLRGFHSGYDDGSGNNHSPLVQMKDKTLITKDGDPLLQSPNKQQVLSEARDIYDRVSRSSYRTKQSMDWEGLNLTWILCGTGALRQLDSSELGERFLDCVIMEEIDPNLEDEVLWRIANRADRSMAYEVNGEVQTQHDPDMLEFMQLTGGYINYLRENARSLLEGVATTRETLVMCMNLGKFVAYMRARPSIRQAETAEREFAARLVSQHVRLAKCLAVVLNRTSLDTEVMRRVSRIAFDTARGITLEITKCLYKVEDAGAPTRSLALWVNLPDDKARGLLRFLRQIKVVEHFSKKAVGISSQPLWRLTPAMRNLYTEVAVT